MGFWPASDLTVVLLFLSSVCPVLACDTLGAMGGKQDVIQGSGSSTGTQNASSSVNENRPLNIVV